jgi:hypothetical protein
MHCDELMRELAVPTDDRDSAALAEHLAICPSCGHWAQRDAQFDRLWNATRPSEPSSQAWDTVWGQIASALDSPAPLELKALATPIATSNGSVPRLETPPGLTAAPSRSRRWNWAAIGLIGLAQAAAVLLLVVGSTWRSSIEIEEGQTVVIQIDGATAKVIDHSADGSSSGVDGWYLAFNAAETFVIPKVAMTE